MNNSLKYVDPEGEFITVLVGGAIGAVVGGGASLISQAASGKGIKWGDVGLAAGTGAIGGALIGTGVGIAAGATMLTGTAATVATGATVAAGTGIIARTVINAASGNKSGVAIVKAALNPKNIIPDALGGGIGVGIGSVISRTLPPATKIIQSVINGSATGSVSGASGAFAWSVSNQSLTTGKVNAKRLADDTFLGGLGGGLLGGALGGLARALPSKYFSKFALCKENNTVPEKARTVAAYVQSNDRTPLQGYKDGQIYNNQPLNGGQKLPGGTTAIGRKATDEAVDGGAKVATRGAANAETKALQTYYPPNSGFLKDPVNTTLNPGTTIDRYGLSSGRYASPTGTPAEMRALPPGTMEKPYSVYEVMKPVDTLSGQIAPWFGQPGLGTQYKFPQSFEQMLKQGLIKEVGN